MKKTRKILTGLFTLTFILIGQIGLSAIENSIPLYDGRLRAYIYVTPGGGSWESSGRYSGGYGVAYLMLESNVTGSGYWRETGSSSYVEDGGNNASMQSRSFSRAYAYSQNGSRVAGVATPVY